MPGVAEPTPRPSLSGGIFSSESRFTSRAWSEHALVALAVKPAGEVLGVWIDQSEGPKFWLTVVNELKALGVNDILIAVTDSRAFQKRSRLCLRRQWCRPASST
jgi:transposase-like protein